MYHSMSGLLISSGERRFAVHWTKDMTKINNVHAPVIGISPAFDLATKLPDSKATHYLRREYTELLAEVGAIPLIINMDMPISAILSLCDGIVISGGEDLDCELYGETLLPSIGAKYEPRIRSDWEYELIKSCDSVGMPILGICYGMQLLNAYYGGTLYQDISQEVPDAIDHRITTHDITFLDDFLGYKQGDVRPIASRHHQAVDELGEGFAITAQAPDGVIEAIANGRHYGMQWHPESDITGIHVYRAFVERCAPGV